ncbi:MAG TPA: RNA ligase family protein [Herpetosiphonaceae bacterium]
MEQFPFSSYEKMAESPQEWRLDEAGFRLLGRQRWVVTEKIHGANFCLLSDGAALACANRRRLLGPGDDFFGHQAVVARLRPASLELGRAVRRRHGAEFVLIYGELFGGAYPHPAVDAAPGAEPVQTGIFYAPAVEFWAFDLALGWRDRPGRRYLGYDEALDLCAAVGLPCAEPLLVGGYAQAMAYPERFESTVPRRLGLPPLAQPNLAEGVVIKPLGELLGDGPRGPFRPVLKKKIAEFAEDARFHQAAKPRAGGGAGGAEADLAFAAFNLITENRLRAALSKLGYRRPGQPSRGAELFGLLVDEVLETLRAARGEEWAALPEAGRAALAAFVRRETGQLLKGFFAGERRRV